MRPICARIRLAQTSRRSSGLTADGTEGADFSRKRCAGSRPRAAGAKNGRPREARAKLWGRPRATRSLDLSWRFVTLVTQDRPAPSLAVDRAFERTDMSASGETLGEEVAELARLRLLVSFISLFGAALLSAGGVLAHVSALSVGSATLLPSSQVFVTGSMTCDAGEFGSVRVDVLQKRGVGAVTGSSFSRVTCDGSAQSWSVTVRAAGGQKYNGGPATVIAKGNSGVCVDFVCHFDEKTVLLQVRLRHG